jgi:hypothetical protein
MSGKTPGPKPLRIVKLVAENFKRLVAVEITPDGNIVEIAGPNEAGKSSIMDVISTALGGEAEVPAMPIRKGESEAVLKVDLGEITVTKTFKLRKDGKTFITTLRVENSDGFKASSPQTVIDGLRGKYTFDPFEFDRLKMRDKFEALKALVPGVDFDAIAKADDADRKERTDINRDVKALASQLEAIVIPVDAPTEKVDESALVDEIASVGAFNAEIERRAERREATDLQARQWRTAAQSRRDEAADWRAKADKLDREAEATDAKAAELEEKLKAADPLPEPKDAAEVKARLDAAKAANALVDRRSQRGGLQERHAMLMAKSNELTAAITKRQTDKLAAIAAAKLPVDGLGFGQDSKGDDIVTLNEIPLDQCSAAQRLRTSIAIAMAANPRLRVLRINEGSLLDKKGMQILAEMCEGRGYQAWVEVVSDEPKAGFFVEEGRIRGAAPVRKQAEAA